MYTGTDRDSCYWSTGMDDDGDVLLEMSPGIFGGLIILWKEKMGEQNGF